MKISYLYLFLAVTFLFQVNQAVWFRKVNNLTLLFYFAGLFSFGLGFIDPTKWLREVKERLRRINLKSKESIFLFLILFLALSLRLYDLTNPLVGHQDEFVNAAISLELGTYKTLDWFGAFPQKVIWISRFPILFYIFQKQFLDILGNNVLAIRLSIFPYIFITVLGTYLVGKELFSSRIGLLAAFIISVLGIDLYFTKIGVHFISSTCLFILALWSFLKAKETKKVIWFLFLGVLSTACYLSYASSYLIIPDLLILIVFLFIKKQISFDFLKKLFIFSGMFLLAISPWIIYAIKVENFFTQRTAQVNFFNGNWSPTPERLAMGESLLAVTWEHTRNCLASFYRPQVGGRDGFWFGRLAFFDPLTFIFFILGLTICFLSVLIKRSFPHFLLLLIVGAAFVSGMIMTIPPPAFQRLTGVFPFISLILAVGLDYILKIIFRLFSLIFKTPAFLFCLAGFVLLAIFWANWNHYQRAVALDYKINKNPDIVVVDYINNNRHPWEKIYLAAFPGFHLEHELFFRTNGRFHAEANTLAEILLKINPKERAFIVLHWPNQESINQIRQFSPHSRIIWTSGDYDVYLVN